MKHTNNYRNADSSSEFDRWVAIEDRIALIVRLFSALFVFAVLAVEIYAFVYVLIISYFQRKKTEAMFGKR